MVFNEFGEEINEEDVKDIAIRFRKMPLWKVDKVWFLCGFICEQRPERFKALNEAQINLIKSDTESAETAVWTLVSETKIDEVKQNLRKVEESE